MYLLLLTFLIVKEKKKSLNNNSEIFEDKLILSGKGILLTPPSTPGKVESPGIKENGCLNNPEELPSHIVRDKKDSSLYEDGYGINLMEEQQINELRVNAEREDNMEEIFDFSTDTSEAIPSLIEASYSLSEASDFIIEASAFVNPELDLATINNADPIADTANQRNNVINIELDLQELADHLLGAEINSPVIQALLLTLVSVVPAGLALRILFRSYNGFMNVMDPNPLLNPQNRRQYVLRAPQLLRARFPHYNLSRIRFNTGMPLGRARLTGVFILLGIPVGLTFVGVVQHINNSNIASIITDIIDRHRNNRNFIPLIIAPVEALNDIWDLVCSGSLKGIYLAFGVIAFIFIIYFFIELFLIIYVRIFGLFNENYFNIKLLNWYLKLLNDWSKVNAIKFNLMAIYYLVLFYFIPFTLLYYVDIIFK